MKEERNGVKLLRLFWLLIGNLPTNKMREIVHLQAGQCGNQIGAKVRRTIADRFTINIINNSKHLNGALLVTKFRSGTVFLLDLLKRNLARLYSEVHLRLQENRSRNASNKRLFQ